MITGLHHVSMKCETAKEIDRVRTFYLDVLGCSICREWPGGMMIDTGNGLIEIFTNGKGNPDKGAVRHFALLCDDVDETAERIREAGYEVFIGPQSVVIPSDPEYPIRMAFCRGPLGEEIELFREA